MADVNDDKKLLELLEKVEGHLRFIRPGHFLWLSLFRGILNGVGIILAAAVVIPLIIKLLQEIGWVPLLGDILDALAQRMTEVMRPS